VPDRLFRSSILYHVDGELDCVAVCTTFDAPSRPTKEHVILPPRREAPFTNGAAATASWPEVFWGGGVELRSVPAASEELAQKWLVHRSRGDIVAHLRWYRGVADRFRRLHAAVAASAAAFMANIVVSWAAARRLQPIGGGTTRSRMAAAATGGSCGVPGTAHFRLPTAPYAMLSCVYVLLRGVHEHEHFRGDFGASCEYERLKGGAKPPVIHENAQELGAGLPAPHEVR